MKITTIDKREIDTDRMPDLQAEAVELVEKSGIREFVQKHDGLCYVMIALPKFPAWITMHLNTPAKFNYFMDIVNKLFTEYTENKFCLTVAKNKKIKEIIYEEE